MLQRLICIKLGSSSYQIEKHKPNLSRLYCVSSKTESSFPLYASAGVFSCFIDFFTSLRASALTEAK